MKKLMLMTLVLVIGTSSLFAINTSPDVPKKEIRTQIVKLLDSPDFTIEKDISIAITFTFSSKGEIVVLNVDSKNSDILNYIRENLNYKKIQHPGEKDKRYSMSLKLTSI